MAEKIVKVLDCRKRCRLNHQCGTCSCKEIPEAVEVRQRYDARLRKIPGVTDVVSMSGGYTINYGVYGKDKYFLAAVKIEDGFVKLRSDD